MTHTARIIASASTADQDRAERIAAKYSPALAALIRTHRSRQA